MQASLSFCVKPVACAQNSKRAAKPSVWFCVKLVACAQNSKRAAKPSVWFCVKPVACAQNSKRAAKPSVWFCVKPATCAQNSKRVFYYGKLVALFLRRSPFLCAKPTAKLKLKSVLLTFIGFV